MSCVFNSARSRIRLIWTAVRSPLHSYTISKVFVYGHEY